MSDRDRSSVTFGQQMADGRLSPVIDSLPTTLFTPNTPLATQTHNYMQTMQSHSPPSPVVVFTLTTWERPPVVIATTDASYLENGSSMDRSISNNRLESFLRTNKRVEFRVTMSTSVMLSSYVTMPLGSMGGSQETVRRELVRLMATLVGTEGSA